MHTRGGASQAGFGLIEVVISAAVLMLVTVGGLSLIDGAQKITVENRSRTVAADLAEQDQERMRGTRVLSLSNYTATSTQTVAGVPYRVDSSSVWLRDASGAPVTCANGSGQAEYMQITSTVTDTSGARGVDPVKVSSLVAPDVGTFGPGQGTLVVEVQDRNGIGEPGIPVTITGPSPSTSTSTDITDDNGCAVFNYFPVGSYTVTYSKSGYTSKAGNPSGALQTITLSAPINAGIVNSAAVTQYDEASSVTFTALTRKVTSGPFVVSDMDIPVSTEKSVATIANSAMTPTGSRLLTGTVNGTTGKVDSIVASGVFPFASGTTVYSGRCTNNEPSVAGAAANYYTTSPGSSSVPALTPGQNTNATVFQPWVTAKVTRGGSNRSGATVYAREITTGCLSVYRIGDTATATTATTGLISDSLAWGKYRFCATYNNEQTVYPTSTSQSVDVKGLDPLATFTIAMPSSGTTSGNCSTWS